MKCRYCNVALSPLRRLTDGEFCCDEHRTIFFQEKVAGLVAHAPTPAVDDNPLVSLHNAVASPLEQLTSQAIEAHYPAAEPEDQPVPEPVAAAAPTEVDSQPSPAPPPEPEPVEAEPEPPARRDHLFPLGLLSSPAKPKDVPAPTAEQAAVFDSTPLLPPLRAKLWPVLEEGLPEGVVPEPITDLSGVELPQVPSSVWGRFARGWREMPRDRKILAMLVPVLLGIALGPSVPKLRVPKVDSTQMQQAVAARFKNLHQTILNRAAVAFADDFRSGLDAWDSRSNLTTSWSYDATGFVQPGPLAVFRPTVDMQDYRFEFLGEIDQKGLGCAFRAPNLDNYYAVKFVIVRPGPLPLIHLVRYAVIHGKEGPKVEKPLPLTARADMMYRVMVDVRGSDFTILTQGQVVDFWSDSRLPKGGVGFFCTRGEKARLRWVEVSHQYDALGRLCAYLAPYGIDSRNGTWN